MDTGAWLAPVRGARVRHGEAEGRGPPGGASGEEPTCTVYSGQGTQATWMSISRQTGKEAVVHYSNGLLLSY